MSKKSVLKFLTIYYESGKDLSNALANQFLVVFAVGIILTASDVLSPSAVSKLASFLDTAFPYFTTIIGLRVIGGSAKAYIEKKYPETKSGT